MLLDSQISLIVTNRNYLLIGSFLAYLLEMLVFARIYHRIYKADTKTFFMPAHLHDARRMESLDQLAGRIVSLETRISFLTDLHDALQKGTSQMSQVADGVKAVLPDGRSGLFRWFEPEPNSLGPPPEPAPAFLVVYDRSGLAIAQGFVEGTGEPPTNSKGAIQYITEHLSDLRCTLGAHINRRSQLESGSPAWTAFDFFYFSLITQTTVGYGDILPNCTKIRKLVTMQVMLGLFLLVVIINLSIT